MNKKITDLVLKVVIVGTAALGSVATTILTKRQIAEEVAKALTK